MLTSVMVTAGRNNILCSQHLCILPEQDLLHLVYIKDDEQSLQRMAELDDEAYIALIATGAMVALFSCTKSFTIRVGTILLCCDAYYPQAVAPVIVTRLDMNVHWSHHL